MIPDGFNYHPNFLPSQLNYSMFSLGQMELLRRAATYRPYVVQMPEDQNLTLPAYSTYEYQLHLKPGSWIYAMHGAVYNLITGLPDSTPGRISIQLTESYSGLPLFNEPVDLATLFGHYFGGEDEPVTVLMPEPRVMASPADLDIEVCNLTGSDYQWRLWILIAEPYDEVSL